MSKLFSLTILSKKLIAKYPEIAATMNPAMHAPISTLPPLKSLSWKTAAPKIAGIDKMKLNLAANSLSNPANNPAAAAISFCRWLRIHDDAQYDCGSEKKVIDPYCGKLQIKYIPPINIVHKNNIFNLIHISWRSNLIFYFNKC